MIRFIDRKDELNLLERGWTRSKAEFIVITGRRRVGKTRMMLEFMKEKEGIFYIAEDVSKKVQIDEFRTRIALYLKDEFLKNTEIREWRDLFSYLEKTMPKNKRMYIAIDEFSYLIRNDPAVLSALQIFWDTFLSKTKVFLIISGSLLGLMQESVLSSASPLYGRRTRDILLEPMRFADSMGFLEMSFEDAVEVHMSVGGVPEYLLKASSYATADEFLKNEFFGTSGYFYREPYFILSQEFREIRKYFSILSAVSLGNTKASEIANFSGMNSREIYPYLENLIRLGFLRRLIPIEAKRKSGIYLLKDPMLDLWFNTVYPNREAIERENFVPDKSIINAHYGKRFEILVRDEIFHRLFSYPETGIWWHRDTEIDIVALNEKKKEILFGEVKWRNRPIGWNVVEEVMEKKEYVKWHNEERKEKFLMVSKSGFTKKCIERMDSEGIMHWDLKDIEKAYRK